MSRSAVGAGDHLQSNLLASLRPADYALLEDYLEAWEGTANQVIYNPGENVGWSYFPCGPSLVSFLITGADGRDVETVLIGREGAVGGIVSQGDLPAFAKIMIQVPGPFLRVKSSDLETAKSRSPALHHLFARYADCLVAQMLQSAACNALHSIEQRTARWIISAVERTGGSTIPLTQERMASMLGVGRSYVSRVLQALRRDGILRTQRGSIVISDTAALQRRSCGCNTAVREHFGAVLKGVYPHERSESPMPR